MCLNISNNFNVFYKDKGKPGPRPDRPPKPRPVPGGPPGPRPEGPTGPRI